MARRTVQDPGAAAGATFNMTPMIDVCFQLIVVFLCSMKFKTLDQKMEAHLPKDVGIRPCVPTTPVVPRVDLRLRRRQGEDATQVLVLDTRVGAAAEEGTWTVIRNRLQGIRRADPAVRGTIDADPDVPHEEVMHALDTFVAAEVTDVAFRGTALRSPKPPSR